MLKYSKITVCHESEERRIVSIKFRQISMSRQNHLNSKTEDGSKKLFKLIHSTEK